MSATGPLSVVKLGGSLLENAAMRGKALEAIAAALRRMAAALGEPDPLGELDASEGSDGGARRD